MTRPYSYCHCCGSAYDANDQTWPRKCLSEECTLEVYRRLDPVSVLLQPVRGENGRWGVVIGKRGIGPKMGEWAIPGGFIESHETAEVAGPRELEEETGLKSPPTGARLVSTANTNHGQLLIFLEARSALTLEEAEAWTPTEECPEVQVVYEPVELAFPHHTDALVAFFQR